MTLTVQATAVEVPVPDNSTLTVINHGPQTVYYGDRSVSSVSNSGSLTAGQSATVTQNSFVSAGTSVLGITVAPDTVHQPALDAVTTRLNSIVTGIAPRQASGFRVRNRWHVDMGNQALVNALFDLTNFTYGTDDDTVTPIITATTLNSLSTMMLKWPANIWHSEVSIRYRINQAQHQSTDLRVWASRVDANNGWYATKSFNGANTTLQSHYVYNSSDQAVAGGTSLDSDISTTTWRILKIRKIEHLMFVKSYLESATEPDWQIVTTPTNVISNSTWQNQSGTAGFSLKEITAGFNISHVTITELEPRSDSAIWNADANWTDTVALAPAFWSISGTPASSTADVVSVPDQYGATRKVFHVLKPTSVAEALLWHQQFYAFDKRITSGTNRYPAFHTVDSFPKAWEVSIWSKGTGVVHRTGTIGAAAAVHYYYDIGGAALNAGQSDYFPRLGPNVLGDGTWDWYETRVRIHVQNPEQAAYGYLNIGFHDGDSSGELWFSDPTMRPVA